MLFTWVIRYLISNIMLSEIFIYFCKVTQKIFLNFILQISGLLKSIFWCHDNPCQKCFWMEKNWVGRPWWYFPRWRRPVCPQNSWWPTHTPYPWKYWEYIKFWWWWFFYQWNSRKTASIMINLNATNFISIIKIFLRDI